jgi:hypothetical protein
VLEEVLPPDGEQLHGRERAHQPAAAVLGEDAALAEVVPLLEARHAGPTKHYDLSDRSNSLTNEPKVGLVKKSVLCGGTLQQREMKDDFSLGRSVPPRICQTCQKSPPLGSASCSNTRASKRSKPHAATLVKVQVYTFSRQVNARHRGTERGVQWKGQCWTCLHQSNVRRNNAVTGVVNGFLLPSEVRHFAGPSWTHESALGA